MDGWVVGWFSQKSEVNEEAEEKKEKEEMGLVFSAS